MVFFNVILKEKAMPGGFVLKGLNHSDGDLKVMCE